MARASACIICKIKCSCFGKHLNIESVAPQALEKPKAADAKKEKALSPTEVVAQRLSMAAAAAANAASSAAGPLANNITSFTSAASNAAAVQAITSQLQVNFHGAP